MQPFASEVADAAFVWLDRHVLWRRHVESFFDQFERSARKMRMPRSLYDAIASPAVLRSLRRRVEAAFSVTLQDTFSLVGHRLVPGQGIGVHTDRPQPGREGYRMVVNLGPERGDTDGGELLFFRSRDAHDIGCAFRGVHNTAIGFELSSRSYHAVAELSAGVRYSLVYSFWRADCGDEIVRTGIPVEDFDCDQSSVRQPRRAPHAASGGTLDSLTQVLVEAGAARTPTPEFPLLPDLVHTYELLRRWRCHDAVCLAGLFHGVYGTAAAPRELISRGRRDRVRAAIGARAEALVYACCAADDATLRRALAEGDPGVVEDRWRRELLGLDRATLAALATLIMAYGVAQRSRFRPTAEQRRQQRRLFTLARPHLDARVREALRRAYERRRS